MCLFFDFVIILSFVCARFEYDQGDDCHLGRKLFLTKLDSHDKDSSGEFKAA